MVADPPHEGTRHCRREDGLAGVGRSHRLDKLSSGRVLQQVACGAGLNGREDVTVGVVGGEDEHPSLMRELPEPLDRLDPAHNRHAQVHEDNVGVQLFGLAYGVGTVSRLTDDLELDVAGEDAADAVADNGVVVDDEDPDGAHRTAPTCWSSAGLGEG